jgi:hypothetical protein
MAARSNGRYCALIDWDDAGWADPVVDLRGLPLQVADAVLVGYRQVMALDGDDTAEARILWIKLTDALRRLRRAPQPGPPSGTPGGPLLELLATAADADTSFARLLRR